MFKLNLLVESGKRHSLKKYYNYNNVITVANDKQENQLMFFLGRLLLGIPTIMAVKFCSKAVSKFACDTLGVPVKSLSYVPAIKESDGSINKPVSEISDGHLHKGIVLLV